MPNTGKQHIISSVPNIKIRTHFAIDYWQLKVLDVKFPQLKSLSGKCQRAPTKLPKTRGVESITNTAAALAWKSQLVEQQMKRY